MTVPRRREGEEEKEDKTEAIDPVEEVEEEVEDIPPSYTPFLTESALPASSGKVPPVLHSLQLFEAVLQFLYEPPMNRIDAWLS